MEHRCPVIEKTSRWPAVLNALFWLSAAEGLAAIAFIFRNPSSADSPRLLGFSPVRLALGAIILALLGMAAWAALRNPGWQAWALARLEERLVRRGRLLWASAALLAALLTTLAFTVLFLTPLSYRLQDFFFTYPPIYTRSIDLLRALFNVAGSLVVWAALICLQTLVFLGAAWRDVYRRELSGAGGRRAVLAALMLAAALFHWVVLIFQLKTFLVIHGWKWYFTPKEPSPRYALFAVMLALACAAIAFAIRRPRLRRSLVVLVVLGYALQVGFGLMAGQGFESLRQKYTESLFTGYARVAAASTNIVDELTHYEERYGTDTYLGTKPPGIILTYALTDWLAGLGQPPASPDQRFERLTKLASFAYPLMAFLVIPALAALSRRLGLPEEDALLPGVIYLSLPNVLLIPVFLDQALYPLLFVLMLILILSCVEKPSFWSGFAVGAAFYAVIYLTFSLLPLIGFALFWLALDAWRHRHERSPRPTVLALLGIAAGLAAAFTLFLGLLNYNVLVRYPTAMQYHHAILFDSRRAQIANAWALDNAEMATWIGFPVILLLLARAGRSLAALMKGAAGRIDELLLTFLVCYAALLTFGKTNAETQRLFLFLVPLVALFSADEAKGLFRQKKPAFLFVVFLELVTAFLIFLFQDFYG